MTGWVANILVLAGWWQIGGGRRHGLLLGVAGSVMWVWIGVTTGQCDLAFIEVALAALGVRAWFLWGKS